jgi:2-isopropylmalate synthase
MNGVPNSAVTIKVDGESKVEAGIGKGTIDAVFKTIDRISGIEGFLADYQVNSVTKGKDALAKVTVKVVFDDTKPAVIGHGVSIDTMVASAKAYIGALNSYVHMKDRLKTKNSGAV